MNRSRHSEIFAERDATATVLGVGSIGSRLALHLAELGFGSINLIDDDVVENHNLPNQAFGQAHVGTKKTEAMIDILLRKGFDGKSFGLDWRLDKGVAIPTSVVACCFDSMSARRLFLACARRSTSVRLFVDGRVTATGVMVYAFTGAQLDRYEQSLYDDDDVRENACGKQSVGITAQIAASLMAARVVTSLTGKRTPFETLADWAEGYHIEHE